MKRTISIALVLTLLLGMASALPNYAADLVDSGIDYTESTHVISANPERGAASARWTVCNKTNTEVVKVNGDMYTLLYDLRCFSAGNDYTSGSKGKTGVGGEDMPISQQTLDSIDESLGYARRAGTGVNLRFAYAWDEQYGNEPEDFGWVIYHIRQLSEILNMNKDVVLSVEAGMVGPWGEMHSSKYSGSAYMKKLIGAWLEYLDEEITVQARAPSQILGYYGLSSATFIKAMPLVADHNYRRLGMFNDGYLGTDADYGTFSSADGHLDRKNGVKFLSTLGDVPYGGELAYVSKEYWLEHSIVLVPGYNIVKEFYDTHLSYLRNIEATGEGSYAGLTTVTFDEKFAFDGMPDSTVYYGKNLQEFMDNRIGYRIVLRDSKHSKEAKAGGEFTVKGKLENVGFGNFLKKRRTEIILKKDNVFYTVITDFDANSLKSCAKVDYDMTFVLPEDIEEGKWTIYMRISNERDQLSLSDITGVEFANKGIFDSNLRANRIGEIEIKGKTESGNAALSEKGVESVSHGPIVNGTPKTGATVRAALGESVELSYFVSGGNVSAFYVNGNMIETDQNGYAEITMESKYIGNVTAVYEKNGKEYSEAAFNLNLIGHDYRVESVTPSGCTTTGQITYICDDCGDSFTETIPKSEHDLQAVFTDDGYYVNECSECKERFAPTYYESGLVGETSDVAVAKNLDGRVVLIGDEIGSYNATTLTDTFYLVVDIEGLNGKGVLGSVCAETISRGLSQVARSAANNKMDSFEGYALDGSGRYVLPVPIKTFSWLPPFRYGTLMSFVVNENEGEHLGTASSGLAGATISVAGIYENAPSYRVIYIDGSGKILDDVSGEYETAEGAFKLKSVEGLYTKAAPSKAGQTFVGWRTIDGEFAKYALGEMVVMPAFVEGTGCKHETTIELSKDATCTESGYYVKTCDECGEVLERETYQALGHKEVMTETVQATFMQDGELSCDCERCHLHFYTQPVEKVDFYFTDTPKIGWKGEALNFAIFNNLFNGMTETEFAPDIPMTRAMLVKVLYNYEGKPSTDGMINPFTDVPEGQWYTDAVKWAYANKVVSGMSPTTFEPNTNLTREQVATIIYNYAISYNITVDEHKELDEFEDAYQVSDWAYNGITWAVRFAIMNGVSATKLCPNSRYATNDYERSLGNATRVQVAQMLRMFIQIARSR